MNDVKNENEKVTEIFFRLLYAGIIGEPLVKHCLKKIKAPHEQRNNIIYRIMCPGCGEKYIGKTERCLISCMSEHGKWENKPMFKHLFECRMFKETCNLYALPSVYNEQDQNKISLTSHILSAVLQNHEILDFNYNWSQLLFLEAYYIKKHNPVINDGLKASKELLLFN